MIDFHSHILPGIDDGSRSTSKSLRMLDVLKSQGVTQIVATPHFSLENDSVESFLKKRSKAIEKLESSRKDDNLPKIIPGAEVYLTYELSKVENLSALCIDNTPYILIEMPYYFWSTWVFSEIQSIIEKQKLIPIIAHIERYYFLKVASMEKILKLFDEDILAQINADSFCDSQSRRNALFFVNKNLVQILGSDMHNEKERTSKLSQARKIIARKNGEAALCRMDSFAEKILKSDSVQRGPVREIKNFFGIYL